jgi:hypothetical protein
MKKLILKTALLACVAIAGNAQALPVAGQGTWETTLLGRDINGYAVAGSDASSVFLYDDVLNVTWLRNANYAQTSGYDSNGLMNWTQAKTWAANLTVGSYTGWRLPTMIDTGAAGCAGYAYSGTDCGYNVQTKSGNLTQYEAGQTVYSEMASLFYDTLGNKAYYHTSGDFQSDFGLANTGDFQNLQPDYYWSGLEYAPDTGKAWYFVINYGDQSRNFKSQDLYALAVRPGDVLVPAVPEPETYALMLAGLAVVGAVARRRKAK